MIKLFFFSILFFCINLFSAPVLEKQDIISLNLLINPGFENGIGTYSASGTLTTTQAVSLVAVGKTTGVWTNSVSGGALLTSSYLVPLSLASQSGAFTFIYNGSSSNIVAEVLNASGTVLASSTLTTRSTYQAPSDPFYLGFTFPASGGAVRGRLRATTSGSVTTYLDNLYIGSLYSRPGYVSGATITDSIFSGGTVSGSTLSNALTLSGTITGGTVSGSTLVNQTASGGTFTNSTINTATISGSTYINGTISGSTILNPTLTGIPVAPTATLGTNTTQIATTEFVLANSSSSGGSGGSTGVNLLINPGFESNTDGYSATSSTITRTTSSTDVGIGNGSGLWTAATSGAILTTDAYATPEALANQSGVFSFLYRGASSTVVAEVLASGTVIATTNLVNRTTYNSPDNPTYLGFNFPAAGVSVTARLRSTVSGSVNTFIDDVHLGSLTNLTQTVLNDWKVDVNIGGTGSPNLGAVAVSSYTELASTNVDLINNSGIGNLTAQIPCTGTNPPTGLTCAGNESIGVVFDLPKGYTDVLACAEFSHNVVTGTVSAGAVNANFQLIETPNNAQTILQLGKSRAPSGFQGTNNTVYMARNVCGTFSFTTSGQKTIRLMYEQQIGGTVLTNVIDTSRDGTLGSPDIHIVVYPLKVAQETAIRIGSEAWKVDANIGGANPSLGTVSQTAYVGIQNSGLDLVNNPGLGNVAAQIPCSGTNPPTGLTCAAGNESVGVSFLLPEGYQDVQACVSFGHGAAVSNALVAAVFQIVETANNAQTILQEGKSRVQGAISDSATSSPTLPNRVCGNFSFTSAGQKTLRLFYEQLITGTVSSNELLADRNSSIGQRDIHWEVYPLNVGKPQPIILNSVSTGNAGGDRIARAHVAGTVRDTRCTSSPCALVTNNGAISSVTRSGAGQYTVNFTAGYFSAPPVCSGSAWAVTVTDSLVMRFSATTALSTSLFITQSNTASTQVDSSFDVICIGPR